MFTELIDTHYCFHSSIPCIVTVYLGKKRDAHEHGRSGAHQHDISGAHQHDISGAHQHDRSVRINTVDRCASTR